MGASRTFAPGWAFVALAAALAGPTSARAGLAIHGPATYTPGEVITITLTGDSEGRLDPFLGAVIGFSARRGVVAPVAATRGALATSFSASVWLHYFYSANVDSCGAVGGLSASECLAVHATESYLPEFRPIDLLPSTLSTWQFDTTDARGDLLFTLEPWDPVGFFDFPAATPLVILAIPEPATAALLGVGLFALGAARRRA